MIHKTSLINPKAKIGKNVEIGPFCIVGEKVKIGDYTKIMSHTVIDGETDIAENSKIFPFSSIGLMPQDLKYKGEKSRLKIGKNTVIREHVTINTGTQGGGMETIIGNNCLLMVGTHIAHDCKVGNKVIFANNSTLAGHVEVQDNVIIGGLSAVHQFVRIGEGSIIGGMSGVTADVIPFGSVTGNRAHLNGLNLIGLKRINMEKSEIFALRKLYKLIFKDNNSSFKQRISLISEEFLKFNSCKRLLLFLRDNSSRSFCLPK